MICEVSMFLGEMRLANVYCEDCGLNMNEEVCDMLHWGGRGYEVHDPFQCDSCVPAQRVEVEDVYDEKFETHCFRELQYINWTHRRLHPQSETTQDDGENSDMIIKDTTYNVIHSEGKQQDKEGHISGENNSSLFTQGLDVVVEAVKGMMPVSSDDALENTMDAALDESRSYHLAAYIDAEADAASSNECDEDEDKLIFPAFSPQKTRGRKETNFKYIKSLLHQDQKRVAEAYKRIDKEVLEVEAEQAPISSKILRRYPSIQVDRTQSEDLSRTPSTDDSIRITSDEGECKLESFEERREHVLNAFYMARRVQNILIYLNKTASPSSDNIKSGSNWTSRFSDKSSVQNHHTGCVDSTHESSLNFSALVDMIESIGGDGGCESISKSRAVAKRIVEVLRNKNTHNADEKGLQFLEFSLLLNLGKDRSSVWKGTNRHNHGAKK